MQDHLLPRWLSHFNVGRMPLFFTLHLCPYSMAAGSPRMSDRSTHQPSSLLRIFSTYHSKKCRIKREKEKKVLCNKGKRFIRDNNAPSSPRWQGRTCSLIFLNRLLRNWTKKCQANLKWWTSTKTKMSQQCLNSREKEGNLPKHFHLPLFCQKYSCRSSLSSHSSENWLSLHIIYKQI